MLKIMLEQHIRSSNIYKQHQEQRREQKKMVDKVNSIQEVLRPLQTGQATTQNNIDDITNE